VASPSAPFLESRVQDVNSPSERVSDSVFRPNPRVMRVWSVPSRAESISPVGHQKGTRFSLPSEFWMAARNLKRRRVRSSLTISGIVVGVTLIVALASIGEGLNSAIRAPSALTSEEAAGLGKVTDIVNMFLAGIGGIALLIAGLGIMNTMMISVAERKREIGIMKAIGAGRRRIMQVFLFESALQGMIGGAGGCLLGFGMTKTVGVILSILNNLEVDIDVSFRSLAVAFLVALISAVLWGAYPSWRASSLKPVEALRNE